MHDDVIELEHTDTVDQLDTVATAAGDTAGGRRGDQDDELVEELLIEEISIDGMCGVY